MVLLITWIQGGQTRESTAEDLRCLTEAYSVDKHYQVLNIYDSVQALLVNLGKIAHMLFLLS